MRSPPDPALLSLNTTTVRAQWNLAQTVDACARHRIAGIAPWRDQVAQLGVKEAARRIRDCGLRASSLSGAGGFPADERRGRQAALDDGQRAVDEALTLGADCLVLVVGGLPHAPDGKPIGKDLAGAREMVRDGLGELLEYARSAGMPLAVEPQHPAYAADRACVNTLAQANDLCDELGEGLGIALNVYHTWWDPQLQREIERAGNARGTRLLAFRICDWLVPTIDPVNDRGMMGDGVVDIPLIRSWMEAVGYRGMHEVEIMSSRNWWKRPGDEVLMMCKTRHESAS
jgi:sugar phosphate isomerase/epimerase